MNMKPINYGKAYWLFLMLLNFGCACAAATQAKYTPLVWWEIVLLIVNILAATLLFVMLLTFDHD